MGRSALGCSQAGLGSSCMWAQVCSTNVHIVDQGQPLLRRNSSSPDGWSERTSWTKLAHVRATENCQPRQVLWLMPSQGRYRSTITGTWSRPSQDVGGGVGAFGKIMQSNTLILTGRVCQFRGRHLSQTAWVWHMHSDQNWVTVLAYYFSNKFQFSKRFSPLLMLSFGQPPLAVLSPKIREITLERIMLIYTQKFRIKCRKYPP